MSPGSRSKYGTSLREESQVSVPRQSPHHSSSTIIRLKSTHRETVLSSTHSPRIHFHTHIHTRLLLPVMLYMNYQHIHLIITYKLQCHEHVLI